MEKFTNNGTASISISRVDGDIKIFWDGNLLLNTSNDRLIGEVAIEFSHCVVQEDLSFFGTESVDLVRTTDAPQVKADFVADPRFGTSALPVSFTDNSTGSIDFWEWDFGDGSPLINEKNPRHTYDEFGIYSVKLTVSGPDGIDSTLKTDSITDFVEPVPDIKANGKDKTFSIRSKDYIFLSLKQHMRRKSL